MKPIDSLIELAKKPTTTESSELLHAEIIRLSKFFEKHGMFVERFESNGFSSLVATTRKTKHPKIFLVSHIDVVPATSKLFSPEIKNEKLHGRGVYDMKFALASYMTIVSRLPKPFTDDFGIIVTTDEEVGGMNGVGYLTKSKGYSCDIAVLPDGSYDWNIESRAKGVWHSRITSKGKSAHAAYPNDGENAYNKLQEALINISSIFDKWSDDQFNPTINIGAVNAGKVYNQVPAFAEAKIDIRYTDLKNLKFLKNEVQSVISKLSNVYLEDILIAESFELDVTNNFVNTYKKIASTYAGKEIKFVNSNGGSDARFFSANNIPCIVTRPRGGGAHSDSEWIQISDLDKFTDTIEEFIKKA